MPNGAKLKKSQCLESRVRSRRSGPSVLQMDGPQAKALDLEIAGSQQLMAQTLPKPTRMLVSL